jgi:DNA-binding transcriptional regulator YiaG
MTPKEIKSLRKKLGFSQHKLAIKIGVTVSAVASWEQGRSKPMQPIIELLRLMVEKQENERRFSHPRER